MSSLTIFGSAGEEALQGHLKVLAILRRGAKRAILTRVNMLRKFRANAAHIKMAEYALFQRLLKGAQVWDFDVLDFNDFFIMKSL